MRIALAALLLAGCTTTTAQMIAAPPFNVVQSERSRDAVTNCLLDRITSNDLIPTRTAADGATTLSFNGRGWARKPAIYVFMVRDNGAGSTVEVRRYPGSSLAAAETCF